MDKLKKARAHMLGFPLNCEPFVSNKKALKLLKSPINNLGSPFDEGYCGLNTFEEERQLIFKLAELYHLPKDDVWGYVSSCGSESNLRALSFAKQKFPDGVCYFSDASHYSIKNSCELINLEYREIQAKDEELNSTQLHEEIDKNRPIIFSLNVGTTIKGAIDRIWSLCNYYRPNYTHVDAALHGMILPFLDYPDVWDFRCNIDSLAVSGHKMLGIPTPCGYFLMRKSSLPKVGKIDYVNSENLTLFGSRSGLAASLSWEAIKEGWSKIAACAKQCVIETKLFAEQINKVYDCNYHNYSNIIWMKRLTEDLIKKWQLASNSKYSHICVMPHVTQKMINKFVKDLRNIEFKVLRKF